MLSDPKRLHEDDDADMGEYLASLSEPEWDAPSLCEGWRVRDVVGHILYGNELKLSTLPFRLARFGFSSDRSGAHYSRERAEGRTPASLLHDFLTRDRWAGTCKVFPPRLVLLDRLVHHQDVRRPLGHERTVPEERLLACLDAAPTLGSVFGAKKRTKGLRFEATDVEWTWGDGPAVRGPGEALLMTMLGRRQPLPELEGDGLDTFRARLG